MTRDLRRDQHGAAMIFGLFFALFLIAAVWSVLGVTQAILYRDHLQDAADAAAFSSAVVNARGMNLIALINMVMAAVLSILVGIRIAETLCLIGITICAALSFVTYGASSSFIPPLASAAKKLHDAFAQVQPHIQRVIGALHTSGEVVAGAIPVGSNARVIDLVVTRYEVSGAAIPSRLYLPVEDDDFTVLCEHAGRFAGTVAMLPFNLVFSGDVGDSISQGLSNAVGALAKAGSKWFCGKGGKPPEIDPPDQGKGPPTERLPRFPSEEACAQANAAADNSPLAAQRKEICDIAAFERMASIPGRDGDLREGQRVCPVDCESSTSAHCPPQGFEDCDDQRAGELDDIALQNQPQSGRNLPSTTLQRYPGNPWMLGQELAVEQCRPKSMGGTPELVAFEWLEQKMTRTYRYNGSAWMEVAGDRRSSEMAFIRRPPEDKVYPCGAGGLVDDGYDTTRSPKFVCEGNPICEGSTPVAGEVSAPCDRTPPTGAHPGVFRETTTQVIRIVGCARLLPPGKKEQIPPVNLEQEMQGSKENLSPFRLQSDLELGGSDFQLRAVVFDHALLSGGPPPDDAERFIELPVPGNRRRHDDSPDRKMQYAGGIAVAQAEYYFDWTGISGASDRSEWMWNMGWRARLRPFRFNHSKADAPRKKQGQSGVQQATGSADAEKPQITALPGAVRAPLDALMQQEAP